MRITQEILWKVANDTITQRTQGSRDILAVFTHGSLLKTTSLLGGSADIDLFIVHSGSSPATHREILRMTDDITLDIAHFGRSDFRQARELRQDPWLGSTIYGAKSLYDPNHFMDFVQASVRGQFNQPANVLGRARSLAAKSRQAWLGFLGQETASQPEEIYTYLQAVEMAGNAIACLSGAPLTIRRFFLDFPERSEAIDQAGLYEDLLELAGGEHADANSMKTWLDGWKAAYKAIPSASTPAGLAPARLNYYLKAMEVLISGDRPIAALWPLLAVWTRAASLILPDAPEVAGWAEFAASLGLLGSGFSSRLVALDTFLDRLEQFLEEWGVSNGV